LAYMAESTDDRAFLHPRWMMEASTATSSNIGDGWL
jgi:hypothetical protein